MIILGANVNVIVEFFANHYGIYLLVCGISPELLN